MSDMLPRCLKKNPVFQHSSIPVIQYLLLKHLCLFEAGSAKEVDITWERFYTEEPHSKNSGKNSIQEWQNEDDSRNSKEQMFTQASPGTLGTLESVLLEDETWQFCFVLFCSSFPQDLEPTCACLNYKNKHHSLNSSSCFRDLKGLQPVWGSSETTPARLEHIGCHCNSCTGRLAPGPFPSRSWLLHKGNSYSNYPSFLQAELRSQRSGGSHANVQLIKSAPHKAARKPLTGKDLAPLCLLFGNNQRDPRSNQSPEDVAEGLILLACPGS